MKKRTKPLGKQNVVGAQCAEIRAKQNVRQKDFISNLQIFGMDINPTSYSKLEGQTRRVSDWEVAILAKALDVSILALYPPEGKKR
jgi:hypothetical protein